jgi:hypothetical protein
MTSLSLLWVGCDSYALPSLIKKPAPKIRMTAILISGEEHREEEKIKYLFSDVALS